MWNLVFPRIKRDLRYGGLIGKKILKEAQAIEKSIPKLKVEFVCVCEREKITVLNSCNLLVLRYIRNLNLPFKKDFKFTENVSRDRPKNGEGNKPRRRRKYMRKKN